MNPKYYNFPNSHALLEQDKKTIYQELALHSICRGEALTGSDCSGILAPLGISKKKYKLEKMSDVLKKIRGIKVLDALYRGGGTCVIIEALAEIDPRYLESRELNDRTMKYLAKRSGEVCSVKMAEKPVLDQESPVVIKLLSVVMASFEENVRAACKEKEAIKVLLQTDAPAGALSNWEIQFFASCKEQDKEDIPFTDEQLKYLRCIYVKLKKTKSQGVPA